MIIRMNTEQLKQELAKSFKEKYTSFTFHYFDNRKDVKVEQITILPKEWKSLRQTIVKLLRSKKPEYANISFKNCNIWREKEYVYPTREHMYKYLDCDEYATGKYIIVINHKGFKSELRIYEKEFLK